MKFDVAMTSADVSKDLNLKDLVGAGRLADLFRRNRDEPGLFSLNSSGERRLTAQGTQVRWQWLP